MNLATDSGASWPPVGRSDAGFLFYLEVAGMSQHRLRFPHRFFFELQSVGVVNDPVHDGIGERWISHPLQPFSDGDLGGQDR
jgi:hypothetical protein